MSDSIDTPSLYMQWMRAPWDEAVCHFPVFQISQISVRGAAAREDMRRFEAVLAGSGAGLASCRLPHDRLAESMLLEACGFRFIEMMYAPSAGLDLPDAAAQEGELDIALAAPRDMAGLLAIAGSAFTHERFRMDYRLAPDISGRRFQRWVANTPDHPQQQLYRIAEGSRTVGFFVTELQADGTCYWHLTALAEEAQGQGYGRRVWHAMMRHARRQGAVRVRSSVAARNVRVLGLYLRLGFTLAEPAMTFHWVPE